jgi:cytochrome c oxidase subunit III
VTARRETVDVSSLPDYAFGHQGLIWWGTLGYMVIEGSMFVIAIVTYFYLRLRVDSWPPSLPDPALTYGTINLVLMLVSAAPALLAKYAAERFDLRRVRIWMVALTAFGFVSLVVRGYEFATLNCRWDDNAYGSAVWLIMGLHTMHVATDVVENVVLSVLTFTGPMDECRFVDISENSLYWAFIVAWWIPVYLTVYFAPRWL